MSKEIEELLPFYVNGTLTDEEQRKVEDALAANPSIKDELDFLQKLRGEIKAQAVENSPGELGLKRLQKMITEERFHNNPMAHARSKITKEQNWRWRIIAVAACLLLVLQSVVMFSTPRSSDLVAAGGGQIISSKGRIVSVTFVPTAQEENIRKLLLSIDANIVDGPSALGVYKIAVSKDVEVAVSKLRAHKNLIESVDYDGRKVGQ